MTAIATPSKTADVNFMSAARLVVVAFRESNLIKQSQEQGLFFDFSTYAKKPDRLTLDHIGVLPESRGHGIASRALELLTELSDVHGVTLDLDVGHDEAEIGLTDWYARHGFDWNDEENTMIRQPQGAVGYHVTTDESLNNILEEGLAPHIGPRSEEMGETEPKIYLFSSKDDVENALSNWLGEQFDDDQSLYVLEVNLNGIEAKREEGQFEITVSEKIESERILNVYDENLKLQKKKSLKP